MQTVKMGVLVLVVAMGSPLWAEEGACLAAYRQANANYDTNVSQAEDNDMVFEQSTMLYGSAAVLAVCAAVTRGRLGICGLVGLPIAGLANLASWAEGDLTEQIRDNHKIYEAYVHADEGETTQSEELLELLDFVVNEGPNSEMDSKKAVLKFKALMENGELCDEFNQPATSWLRLAGRLKDAI